MGIFIWAVRSGQFDDIEGIKYRALEAEIEDKQEKYKYESADIEERRGIIPKWLIFVYLALIAWGIAYFLLWPNG
ncbi:MAG: cbb3-type cytochrome oxidase assembly protein CcoS [Deltaproteobacteria bacterium]|nr:cbb3-type cytochrome oxidase assembly protein CcoS [Deltaproteobacteria bacterium]